MTKCRYIGKCELYEKSRYNETCDKNGGVYNLDDGRFSSCYISLAEQEKKSKDIN
jgi:hypothetical protein